jgi:Sulfotransferase family
VSTALVYIGGAGRSGSTLLERMLARVPGVWPVGELVFIWERGLQRNDRCGCGARFLDCGFWNQVGKAGFGGWERVDTGKAARLRRAVDRHRNLDRIAGLRHPGPLGAALAAYEELTSQLYRGIREVSGASVIVDSSKHAGYALVLRRIDDIDVRLVHLIRDSRGVAHSWSRPLRKLAVGDGDVLMSTHSPRWAVSLWAADNIVFDLTARSFPRATRVRYEDLVAQPGAELMRIMGDLALPAVALPARFPGDTTAELETAHALSGNPALFGRGQIDLRVDDDWRTAMSRRQRAMITAMTWPLLRRYGYATGGRGRRPPP